jgi:hypothetical protein
MVTQTQVKPNTVVQYKGGGYDGCFYEWNYAYYDAKGHFHNIVATGRKGCETEEELLNYLEIADGVHQEFDLYELDEEGEVERFGRETPISHLLTVGQWLAKETDVKLTVVCEECEETVEVAECDGEGLHGIGGIMLEHDRIICAECHSNGTCFRCGEYVGEDRIDGESGYCTGATDGEQWCKEQHWDEWNA